MKDATVEHFKQLGWEVQVSDLYAMGFNPAASAADFGQRQAWNSKTLTPDIVAEVEKVQWADLIIFSFPVYWYSMPAIKQDYLDHLARLDTLTPLAVPSLYDYDATMHPLPKQAAPSPH